MLNKTLCGYCLYRELQKRYLEQFSEEERTSKVERRIKKRLQMHERHFSKWFQKILKKTHGLVPCLHSDCKSRILNYDPLDFLCWCSDSSEPPENCKFILEHTLAINDTKKGKSGIE
jgi:hypothetical protein